MKDTREYIIDEAYKLFLTQSYEAVSISDISKAIGFTKGALYHHFKNKEELFRSVIDKHFPLTSISFDDENISLKEYTEVCIDHIHNLLKETIISNEEFTPVNFLALIADSFRHYEGFAKKKSMIIEYDVEKAKVIISNAIKRGEIRDDIDISVVAMQYLSLSIGLAGDFIRNNSVESSIQSLRDQLNQLYYLLKK
ncbi:MAG: TetR/AcrR family transcriptional regulator [Bacteroidetes bacterium]|nr:TetR/AcrR family transcriptional regulator [Bacteroidota bacterium]